MGSLQLLRLVTSKEVKENFDAYRKIPTKNYLLQNILLALINSDHERMAHEVFRVNIQMYILGVEAKDVDEERLRLSALIPILEKYSDIIVKTQKDLTATTTTLYEEVASYINAVILFWNNHLELFAEV